MRTGPIRRTDWLPVGDTVEGEQLHRGYDSQSEGSSAEEEAMRADPGYDEWDDYFSQAILKKIGERTGKKPNYFDDEENSEDSSRDDSSGDDEGLLERPCARRCVDDKATSSRDADPSMALLCGL